MAVQTIYPNVPPEAVEGHLANMEKSNLISKTVKTADGIGFGKAVTHGAEDGTVVVTGAGTTFILGITVREQSVRPGTPNKFALNDSARIATKGVVYVVAGANVTRGAQVNVVVATGAFTSATGAGIIAINGAHFDNTASAGDLVKVRLG